MCTWDHLLENHQNIRPTRAGTACDVHCRTPRAGHLFRSHSVMGVGAAGQQTPPERGNGHYGTVTADGAQDSLQEVMEMTVGF